MNTPSPPNAKKTGSGCVIALGIFGVIGLLLLVGGGVVAYKVATSPEGSKIISAVGETKKLVDEAGKAPGTKELRKLGCMQAMVMDAERWLTIFENVLPEAGTRAPLDEKVMVICQLGLGAGKSAPTCDDVKTTYLAAVPTPAGDFLVQVTGQGDSKPRCEKRFTQAGTEKP
jgi:hypothetical protein